MIKEDYLDGSLGRRRGLRHQEKLKSRVLALGWNGRDAELPHAGKGIVKTLESFNSDVSAWTGKLKTLFTSLHYYHYCY